MKDVIAIGARTDDSCDDAPAVLDYGFRTRMQFDLAHSHQLSLADRDQKPMVVDACLLHHPQLAELFAGFRDEQGSDEHTEAGDLPPRPDSDAVHRVTLAVGGTADSLSESAKGVLILHSKSDNPPLGGGAREAHLLADEVLAAVSADLLELKTFEHVLDLWAGIGARAAVLSEQIATIVAVEEAELPAAALHANLEEFDNVDAWHGEMLPKIRKLRRGQYRFDAALLAPPGGHVDPELFSLLTRMRIRRCALITEEPVRLARALAALDEEGYQLTAVQPVDLQPHQPGVTLVARFDRK